MTILNMMESIISEIMKEHWDELQMPCSCEICKTDLLALTLNRIPSKYTSKERGRVIIKALYMDEQLYADLLRELVLSSVHVASKPSHN